MALVHHLFTATTPSPSRSVSLSSSSLAAASNSFTRLHKKSIGMNQKLFNGPQVQTPIKLKNVVIVKSSSDVDGMGPVPEPPYKIKPEGVAVQDLPPECRMQFMRLLSAFGLLKNTNQELKLSDRFLTMYELLNFLPEEAQYDIMQGWLKFLLEKEASKEAH
ncbi:hypothetical protein LguiB_004088 [Lonicera macranthoides]